MSQPKRSNRDYGYQPNMATDLYDMESKVTTEGMRMAGKVEKHSEFMEPNKQPYDQMEYLYPYSPSTMQPMNPVQPVSPGRNWPANPSDCLTLWNKLFPKHRTGTGEFVPDRNDNIALDKYRKGGCPVDYIPTWCCPKVKISGPRTVEVNSTTQYSLTDEHGNCDYSWSVTSGRIPGGTFYAPASPTKVKISVSPFMGDDNSQPCDQIEVAITDTGGCGSAYISVPSTQMSTGSSQTLTALSPLGGTTYTWVVSSGGGSVSPSTGTSTTYTAPASNANCTQNPTIQLKAGATVCDSVTIAVNELSSATEAVIIMTASDVATCQVQTYRQNITCDGVAGAVSPLSACGGCSASPPDCGSVPCTSAGYTAFCNAVAGRCCPQVNGIWTFITTNDVRTVAMKAAGCCPYQLL